MNKVITIGREFGSGGRELGRRLAQELGYEYYDKEIISEIAKKTSLSEEYVRNVVERTPHNLYPITTGHTISYVGSPAFAQMQSVYLAQTDIIKELAEKAPCVIVGRCADYILHDKDPFRIFVYASMESKLRRCKDRAEKSEALTDKKLAKQIRRIDKERAKYYNFYTGLVWGDLENYDLCINTTDLEIKSLVPVIAKLFK